MIKLDDELKSSMNRVAAAKEAYFGVVCTNLKLVSELQSRIVEFETHLGILKDALAYQKRQFAELKHVELLPRTCSIYIWRLKRVF